MEEKEFDFEKSYNDILERAKENEMYDDMIFQTLMREFKRVKELCDRMVEELNETQIASEQEGSKGQYTYKSNPVIKDYIAAHKALVSTSVQLEKMLANVSVSDGDNGLFD